MRYNLMKNKAWKSMSVVGLVAAAIGLGGVAAFQTDTHTTTNAFVTGSVMAEISEPNFPGNDSDEVKKMIPYQEVTKDPIITNTGNNDAIVFIKITAPVETLSLVSDDGTKGSEALADLFWYKLASDSQDTHQNHFNENWIELTDKEEGATTITDNRTYVFGYKTKLEPGETTTALFEKVQLKKFGSKTITNDEKENIVLEGFAIQADAIIGADNTYLDTDADLTVDDLNWIYDAYVGSSSSN